MLDSASGFEALMTDMNNLSYYSTFNDIDGNFKVEPSYPAVGLYSSGLLSGTYGYYRTVGVELTDLVYRVPYVLTLRTTLMGYLQIDGNVFSTGLLAIASNDSVVEYRICFYKTVSGDYLYFSVRYNGVEEFIFNAWDLGANFSHASGIYIAEITLTLSLVRTATSFAITPHLVIYDKRGDNTFEWDELDARVGNTASYSLLFTEPIHWYNYIKAVTGQVAGAPVFKVDVL